MRKINKINTWFVTVLLLNQEDLGSFDQIT